MEQRGRGEGAAGSVPAKPVPPPSLPLSEAGVWEEVVGALPPEWFPPESLPMLEAYCGAVVRQRWLAERLRELQLDALAKDDKDGKPKGLDFMQWKDLQSFIARETAMLANLATKMRLTQQSMYSHKKGRGNAAKSPEPWKS